MLIRARDRVSSGGPERQLVQANSTLLFLSVVAGIAYVVTPASAYGPPHNPYLFGPSLRYAFPTMLAALLLVPIATTGRHRIWGGAVMVVVLGVLAVELTSRVDGSPSPLASQPRALAAVLALWVITNVLVHRRRDASWGTSLSIAVVTIALSLTLVGGYYVATRYTRHRYTNDTLWSWARTVHHARLAVVGYSAQYPLTGLDLSNRVQYLGRAGKHGAFSSYRNCSEFRTALRRGGYDYLVAGTEKWELEPASERQWEETDPGATSLLTDRRAGVDATLFRIDRHIQVESLTCH